MIHIAVDAVSSAGNSMFGRYRMEYKSGSGVVDKLSIRTRQEDFALAVHDSHDVAINLQKLNCHVSSLFCPHQYR